MNRYSTRILVAVGIGALSNFVFVGCGTENSSVPNASSPGLATDLGNFNMTCNGQAGSQQKQVPFQQQQQSGCKQQSFEFQQQKISDYDVNLDCANKTVGVRNKGADQKQQNLPIQSNGTVSGKIQYQQQIQGDGKGNQTCWVQYEVDLNGKAQCGNPINQPTIPSTLPTSFPNAFPSAFPSSFPSASASPLPLPNISPSPGKEMLSLTASVAIQQTSSQALQKIGVLGSGPAPSPSPSTSPSTSPSPNPSGTPVVICVVDNPCPIVGSTNLSCGQ